MMRSHTFRFPQVLHVLTFSHSELSIAPHLNHQLVPPHMVQVLASQGLDINNFTPMTKQEMMAKLD